MQRLIGSMLILTATSGAGYLYASELQKELERIRYLRYVAGLIKGELLYTNAPLPDVFRSVGRSIRSPFSVWLKRTADEIEKREESGFGRIWNRCIDRYLKELRLKPEHAILLKEMGTFLGQHDKETMDHSFQIYLTRMDMEIEKKREGLASKKRLVQCLGIMGGLFLIVILF